VLRGCYVVAEGPGLKEKARIDGYQVSLPLPGRITRQVEVVLLGNGTPLDATYFYGANDPYHRFLPSPHVAHYPHVIVERADVVRYVAPTKVVAPTYTPAADVAHTLERKRTAGEFDVFLCHHGPDKPQVKWLGEQLKQHGILPWLDEWELRPGLPWIPELERRIGQVPAAAVCVGASGTGPWQEEEISALLIEYKNRGCPVIPVILPDCTSVPVLPAFLTTRTWVDFRRSDPDPLRQLIWGITGERPADP
jgi:hypothetical protein